MSLRHFPSAVALVLVLVFGNSVFAKDPVAIHGWKAASACTGVVKGFASGTAAGIFVGVNSLPSCLKGAHDLGVAYGSRNLPPNLRSGYQTLSQQGIPVYGGLRRR
jgi:hypothetical protein